MNKMNLEPEPDPGGVIPLLVSSDQIASKKEAVVSAATHFNNSETLTLWKDLSVSIEKNEKRCEELWREFSPFNSLFDTWEFRYAFYHGYQFPFHFILLMKNTEVVGLLPLCFCQEEQRFFWFGTSWQENNQFFVKDPKFLSPLLRLIPAQCTLNAIRLDQNLLSPELSNDEPKFILNLGKMKNLEDFYHSLKKKKRYNLKKDYQRIASLQPEVIFDNFKDLSTLIDLNKNRFESRGIDTAWQDPRKVKTFQYILDLPKLNPEIRIHMITVKIANKIAGVDLMAIYRKKYYCLKGGNNIQDFSGIGNFLSLYEIEDAIQLGMTHMDFLSGDFGYKSELFTKVDQLKIEKNL